MNQAENTGRTCLLLVAVLLGGCSPDAYDPAKMDLKPNRFDLGGQGTQKDPGLMWYVDAVHKRTRKKEERPA